MVDYYEEFGLDRSMSCGEIQAKLFEEKKSWSRKQNAPSLDKRQEAERKIEEIAKCMSIFESEEKRHAYDEELNYFRAEEAKNQQAYTEYPVPQVNTVPQVATQTPRQPMSAEQKKRIRNLIIIGSAATTFVIILFIVLISVYVRIATTINLDQYISAEFSGYDGYGTVRLVMDTQALKKKTRFADTLFDNYFSKGIVSECEDNPNGQLYNGDKVNVVFNIDEKAIYQKFRLRIKYSDDLSYKVNGLVELNKKEVFDGVNVVFSGISTNGTAEVEISDSLFNGDVRYSLDKSEGLKNGDTVTVFLQCDDEDVIYYIADNYGFIPKTSKKEFIVEGLGEYVSDVELIDAEFIEYLNSMSYDNKKSIVAEWKYETLDEMELIGYYFLSGRKDDQSGDQNLISLIYKTTIMAQTESNSAKEDFTYYEYYTYSNIVTNSDGDIYLDTESFEHPDKESFEDKKIHKVVRGGLEEVKEFCYYGYVTLEDLKDDYISLLKTSYSDNEFVELNKDNRVLVSSIDDLSEDIINDVSDYISTINCVQATNWMNTSDIKEYLDSIDLQEEYFGVSENGKSNALILVYKVECHETVETGYRVYEDNNYDYYFSVEINDIYEDDSAIDIEKFNNIIPGQFRRNISYFAGGYTSSRSLYYYGYETYEDMYNNVILPKSNNYKFEKIDYDNESEEEAVS